MAKHLQIKIYGRVQGIGFRWSAYEKFVELGLVGKAENGSDGTVEIDVSGEDFAMEKLVEWCHAGPQGAKVSKVEVIEIPNKKDESDNQNRQQEGSG